MVNIWYQIQFLSMINVKYAYIAWACVNLYKSKRHFRGIQKQHWPSTKGILTRYKSDTDPVEKWYWPGTKAILPRYKSDTVWYRLVPLHKVSVPAIPEPVTSSVLVYRTGACTGTVCKTCIERYRIGTLYRIQRYRTGTTYHRWTVPERVPIDTGMLTGCVKYLILNHPW